MESEGAALSEAASATGVEGFGPIHGAHDPDPRVGHFFIALSSPVQQAILRDPRTYIELRYLDPLNADLLRDTDSPIIIVKPGSRYKVTRSEVPAFHGTPSDFAVAMAPYISVMVTVDAQFAAALSAHVGITLAIASSSPVSTQSNSNSLWLAYDAGVRIRASHSSGRPLSLGRMFTRDSSAIEACRAEVTRAGHSQVASGSAHSPKGKCPCDPPCPNGESQALPISKSPATFGTSAFQASLLAVRRVRHASDPTSALTAARIPFTRLRPAPDFLREVGRQSHIPEVSCTYLCSVQSELPSKALVPILSPVPTDLISTDHCLSGGFLVAPGVALVMSPPKIQFSWRSSPSELQSLPHKIAVPSFVPGPLLSCLSTFFGI